MQQLLTDLQANFAPGHILGLLNNQRRESIVGALVGASSDEVATKVGLLSEHLVNPAVLPTMLGLALLSRADAVNAVERLIRGETEDYDAVFAPLGRDDFLDDEEALRFVRLETSFTRGLYALALDSFVRGGGNALAHALHEPTIDRMVSSTGEGESTSPRAAPSAHQARYNLWRVFNMPLGLLLGEPERFEALLWQYGLQKNSFWHNLREQREFDFSNATQKANLAAAAGGDELASAANELRVAERLMARARRFYLWNPAEAAAHHVGGSASKAIMEALDLGRGGDIDDTQTND